jgi:hypothetical protein
MKRFNIFLVGIVLLFAITISVSLTTAAPQSDSGVSKLTVKVPVGSDGKTMEQRNIARRIEQDNKPGAMQFIYVQSSFNGKLLFASTVDGKVTSSGKRLNPYMVESRGCCGYGFPLRIGDWSGHTLEVLEDDGTYGHSIPYLYWWDVNGVFYKLYPTGGQIIHITDQPWQTKDVVIDMRIVLTDGKEVSGSKQ